MWLFSDWKCGGSLPFKLHAGQFMLGRSASCKIVVLDSSLSRVHGRLTVNPAGDMHFLDLGSRNGTFVNGKRVSECNLRPSDDLRAGLVPLRIAAAVDQMPVFDEEQGSTRKTRVSPSHESDHCTATLTVHQQIVLKLVIQGLSDDQIASTLDRSYYTVRNHLKALFLRFGVHSRQQLTAKLGRTKYFEA